MSAPGGETSRISAFTAPFTAPFTSAATPPDERRSAPDYDGRHILGRLEPGTSLASIWRGAAYQQARRMHRAARQHEIALCRACTKAFL